MKFNLIARKNMSIGQTGKKHSEETKLKIASTLKFLRVKKIYYCIDCSSIISSKNYKRCYKCEKTAKIGRPQKRPFGKQASNYKHGNTLKKYRCLECKKNVSIKASRGSGLCRSCAFKGKRSSLYINGRGYKKYPKEFTESLKRKIRLRDNYTCQNCGMTNKQHLEKYKRTIEVHHIDSNRNNCKEINLLTLCKHCNLRAIKDRRIINL